MGLTDKHIDAVITWVDGSDPLHREKRNNTLKSIAGLERNELVTGHDDTRFIDNGELRYCILSIRKFAPWIHRIFLVTDGQTPRFLTADLIKSLNIRIVDHKEIFEGFEDILPTFNNRTIETALWRIPEISDRYIYFNDDFLLVGEVNPDDFYQDDKVVLRGQWSSIINYGPVRLKLNDYFSLFLKKMFGITRSMHLLQQIQSAKLAGFIGEYYRAPHVPHPLKTKTIRRYFDDHPHHFRDNIRYKFRNKSQFSAIYLANHLEIKKNGAVLRDADDALMINGELDFWFSIKNKLKRANSKHIKFLCLQGFESINEEQKNIINQTLQQIIGDDFSSSEISSETLVSHE